MGPEYLTSIPINILHLYIEIFNEKKKEEELARKRSQGK